MRLIALIVGLILTVACAAVDINKPGVRVSGLVPGGEARRLMQGNTVAEAGERGDCASAYAADGTLITSSSDGVSVNCGGYGQYGYGGGSSSYDRAEAQARLDNPSFVAPAEPQSDTSAAQDAANKKKAAEAFKKQAVVSQDAAALAEGQ